MSEEILKLLNHESGEIQIAPDSELLKQELLEQAASVTGVSDELDADLAANALKSITEVLKDVEAARKTVKAPVLELSRKIDGVAKDFGAQLGNEKTRISKLLGTFEAEQRRKQKEAEREAARKEAERIEQANEDGDLDAAVDDIAKIRTEAAQVAHRPSGTVVRETWKFELLDIQALHKAAPHLCKIEPNNVMIREAIKTNQNIPGLRVWKEAKTHIK